MIVKTLAALSVGFAAQAVDAANPVVPARAIDGASSNAPSLLVRQPLTRKFPGSAIELHDVGATRPAPVAAANAAGEFHDYKAEVGYTETAPYDVLANPNWVETPEGGLIWTVELAADATCGMRAQLRGRWGDDGLELRVYDPATGSAFGPYTRPKLDENGDWWTTFVSGGAIGLEFYRPPNEEHKRPPLMPELVSVARHWRDAGCGCDCLPLNCGHLDIACSPEWLQEGAAVARYQYIENGGCFVCTGALINRSPSDLSPLFLTADHCIDTQATANTVACIWFYENDVCGDGTIPTNPNLFPRTDGALLLKTRNNSDMSLLGLFEPPVGDWWLGWDAGGWTLQSDANGIHHPAGNAKRISFGDVTTAEFVIFGQNDAHVWRVDFDSGNTEGGSSGSPILDDSGRIRGQLKGGPACSQSYYGRFGVSYETLQPYIDGMASPVYVEAGVGGGQFGTSGDPFNTVFEANFCVFAGDEVRIRAGDYSDRFTIWRPMTLNSENGVARIGTP